MKLNIRNLTNKQITILHIILSTVFMGFVIELLNKNILFTIGINKLIFNFLIIGMVYLFVTCITNRLKLSIIISNILLFGLAFANYSVLSLRGTPLSLLDILSINTGLTIASTYTLIISHYLIFGTLAFAILIFFNTKINFKFKKSKKNIFIRICLISFVIIFFILLFTTPLIKIFFLNTNLWVPSSEYHSNGFLASFVKQAKDLNIKKPDNYSLKKIEDIYNSTLESKNSKEKTNETDKPNIIVIMNESFADMSVHHSFGTSADYIPYFRTVWKNSIHGYTHTSVYGGKTPNSEWEFLTNNSMAFFSYGSVPYQQFIKSPKYSLVSTLEAQEYDTIAIHPWYKTGYRRSSVYPLFGFNNSIFYDDIKEDVELIREYPSDLSTYKLLTKKYEERDTQKPFFCFTITMQNHSGYDYEGEDFTSTVHLTDIENCPKVEQYLSLLKESDNALKYLINYFENVDENTIILFFGDHQPPYIEQEFWDYINQDKTDSLEDAEKGYLTPYFIWSNYNLEDANVPDISLNYLSCFLLDVAGLKTTPYQDFLKIIQKEIPVITGHGYLDKTGTYHEFNEQNEYTPLIRSYEILEYNNMFGEKSTYKEMFEVQRTSE